MSCDCKVKPQYRGKSISFVGGGLTLVFPLDGSNPYDEKTCKQFSKFFECIPDIKPTGRKSRKTDDGLGGSRVQGNEVGKVGRGRKRRSVSAENSGSVSKLKDVKSSLDAEEQLSSVRPEDGERKSAEKD